MSVVGGQLLGGQLLGVSCRVSVVGCQLLGGQLLGGQLLGGQLLGVSCWVSVVGCQLLGGQLLGGQMLGISCWESVVWRSVVGCQLSRTSCWQISCRVSVVWGSVVGQPTLICKLDMGDCLIDDQISIAMEARDTLVNQRQTFKAIQTKLNDLSNRFPMVNNLVQRINLRKRRDAIILAVVIGLCLSFLLWWIVA